MSESSRPSDVFRERVRTAREKRGLSQAELAKRAGLQDSAISHFETGARKPSFDNLRRLADALDVTTDYLLGRVAEMDAYAGATKLHRHGVNLTSADLDLTEQFIKLLEQRNKRQPPMKGLSGILASQHAEQVLRDLDMASLPIDPKAVAARHEIMVQAKPGTAPGVSGILMRVGDSFGIMYATHIESEGFQRFSIAHELGHYFLPGHIDAVLGAQGVHESRAGFTSLDRYESEADHFAAGLLMPKSLFKPALDRAGQGLAAILSLAELCVTSLPATAIRLTQCTRDPVAIVVSTGNSINYCFMSDELKQLDGIDWIRRRTAVPKETVTFEFNQTPGNVLRAQRSEGVSDLQEWFGGRRSIEVKEDVIGLGGYGKTLTVLYGFDLPEPEEEAEEESLIESWTPRFRRR